MRKYGMLVCGIGFNDNKYQSSRNGKTLKVYQLWYSMLLRCTEKLWIKYPTYTGTTCSENFKSYSFFYEWCQEQKGFGNNGNDNRSWQLDKDILVKGNKLYSEDTCVFVPQNINSLLIKCDASRGEWPVGISWNKAKKMFKSDCSDGNGKQRFLGYFKTTQEAFLTYKTYKEGIIKQVANEYQTQLDSRVYQALMKYEVEITD